MKIYEKSVTPYKNDKIFMANINGADYIVAEGVTLTLSHTTAGFLRSEFPGTAPSGVLKKPKTFGAGDRLGIAAPGHLRCFENPGADAAPVLAQQSVRELNLTGRTYADVLDAATFACFREGFHKLSRPWGFDGDHLKTLAEIDCAVSSGCTMLTLDCSEKIGRGTEPDAGQREYYLGKSFEIEGLSLKFNAAELSACGAIYNAALDFICRVYEKYIVNTGIDFEISIDETSTPTTPLQHFFVASELKRRGVDFDTLAPRFCGEFQKGIDYIGDLSRFESELISHAAIARHFGYKLSVHSGSDKLSIFPLIKKHCGSFHVKTAGTSWLEAVKLVSMKDPQLFRQAYALALESFGEARTYYHVSAEPSKIPDISRLDDSELPLLLTDDNARQLLHITYGQLLRSGLSDRLFSFWRKYEEDYFALLQRHIGRHLDLLGIN
jgi:hypothetical protein